MMLPSGISLSSLILVPKEITHPLPILVFDPMWVLGRIMELEFTSTPSHSHASWLMVTWAAIIQVDPTLDLDSMTEKGNTTQPSPNEAYAEILLSGLINEQIR